MRVTLCGDPAVGKTSLVRTLATGDFAQEEFDTSLPVEAVHGKLLLVDTNGQEDNDRMRGLAYKDADAFMILFSIISPTSYNSVVSKWQPEVQRANASGRPVILIGTKCDLRNDPDALQRLEARHLAPVSFDQGLKLARQIGAVAYVECASNLSNGLSDLSETLNNFLNGGSKAKGKSKSSNASKSQSKRGGCTLL